MKKHLVICLLLLSLLAAGTVWGKGQILESRDRLEFAEETISGDIAAAEGIRLAQRVSLKGHVYWNSVLSVENKKLAVQNSSSYSKEAEIPRYWNIYSNKGIHIMDLLEGDSWSYGVMENSRTVEPRNMAKGGIVKAFSELLKETPAGSRGTKRIRLGDYLDYYPLSIQIDLSDENGRDPYYGLYTFDFSYYTMDRRSDPYVYTMRRIADFFAIPVLEDQYAVIDLYKSNNDKASNQSAETWGLTPVDMDTGDSFGLYTNNAVGKEAIYFYFNNRTLKGNLVDTSHIPGGYGIYRLPIGSWTFTTLQEGKNHSEEVEGPIADQLSMWYGIDEEAQIQHIWLNEDQSRLLIHQVIGNNYYVDVVDTSTGIRLQQLDLGKAEIFWNSDTQSFSCVYEDSGDYEILWFNGADGKSSLKLISDDEAGNYVVYMDIPLDIDAERDIYLKDQANGIYRSTAFDGKRLAIAGSSYNTYFDGTDWSPKRYSGCSPYLFVIDREGIKYFGIFRCSLDKANTDLEIMDHWVRPWSSDAVHLSW